MKIGSHVSNNGSKMLIGSVEEILSYGGNCLMVYLGAPQNTFRKPIENQKCPTGNRSCKGIWNKW